MKKNILIIILSVFMLPAIAQTASWKLMHRGNRYFRAEKYEQAHQCYTEALKINPKDTKAMFNLGDACLAKGDANEAMSLYSEVTKLEKARDIRAKAYHNMGYISQSTAMEQKEEAEKQKYLREAIKHYKDALRNNPNDDDTRYNLALCQKQLKDSENKNGENQQQKSQPQTQQQQTQPQSQQNTSSEKNEQKQPPQQDMQTQQLLNLSRQAEQRTQQKLNQIQPRRQSLDKNW